jgi:hypothetical protein
METTLPSCATKSSNCSRSSGVMCALTWAVLFERVMALGIKAARKRGAENAHQNPEEEAGKARQAFGGNHAALRLCPYTLASCRSVSRRGLLMRPLLRSRIVSSGTPVNPSNERKDLWSAMNLLHTSS